VTVPCVTNTVPSGRPTQQAAAAFTSLLGPVGVALQHLTGMHKSKVTSHSAYLSRATVPGTGGDVEVLWYSGKARSPRSRLRCDEESAVHIASLNVT
jgi:hypothetical protein